MRSTILFTEPILLTISSTVVEAWVTSLTWTVIKSSSEEMFEETSFTLNTVSATVQACSPSWVWSSSILVEILLMISDVSEAEWLISTLTVSRVSCEVLISIMILRSLSVNRLKPFTTSPISSLFFTSILRVRSALSLASSVIDFVSSSKGLRNWLSARRSERKTITNATTVIRIIVLLIFLSPPK